VGFEEVRPLKIKVAAVQTKTFLEADEPPMPWRTKPGILRDWRRPEVFRKNFPDW